MASDVCPGPCNNTYRRRLALHENEVAKYAQALETRAHTDPIPEPPVPPDLQPWHGDPVWCPKCTGRIKNELTELDDLAALIFSIPPLARPADDGNGRVAGTKDARSPSARMDDVEDLNEWLRSWEAAARAEDDPKPRRGILAQESTTVTAWLYHHFDVLIYNVAAAGDFGEEIGRWHRDLARRAAAGRMTRHMKKTCPRCHLYTLWLTIGEDYIRCANEDCARMLSREEYELLTDAA